MSSLYARQVPLTILLSEAALRVEPGQYSSFSNNPPKEGSEYCLYVFPMLKEA